ncbi:MAG: quinone-dependent dihydroorotate dehydrogenase [Alphaproteobacteria bacterium]|nr:MAG: quinone-dependent dihydroorotate dehydrogenase [Alphaproteobacteria bacterium]
MSIVERAALAILHRMDPERAHRLTIAALRHVPLPLPGPITSERLATRLAGMELPNPVGLAAGMDKNAEAVPALSRAGFGFLEVGAVTPRPQPGNPRPRLFRLPEAGAVINRFGFNNEGMEVVCGRLSEVRRRGQARVPVGLNLGANKDSPDRMADYVEVLRHCAGAIDFATVNVSSPNTERLRELQGPEALSALLADVLAARDALAHPVPVFLKIAPDLGLDELGAIAKVAVSSGIDGVIATNTTLSRPGVSGPVAEEAGGLSGAPLFEMSTRTLARLARLTGGKVPLVGVGGIASGAQAFEKIRAGASAVQLYSALAYRGLSLVQRIVHDLDRILAENGFANVAEAVGTGTEEWL